MPGLFNKLPWGKHILLGLNTLRGQLTLWGLVLILLPSIAFLLTFVIYELHDMEREQAERLQAMLTMQHNAIDRWFDERTGDIRDIADWESAKSGDADRFQEKIARYLAGQHEFFNIILINAQGIAVADPVAGSGTNYADREYFKKVKQGDTVVSRVLSGRGAAKGAPIIAFAVPVYDNGGQFSGAVMGAVKLDTIDAIMRDFRFGDTGETFLVTKDGMMITESRFTPELIQAGIVDQSTRLALKVDSVGIRKAAVEEYGFATGKDYRGVEVMGAFQRMDDRQWIIIGKIDKKEAYAPFYRQIFYMLLIFTAELSAALLLTLALARRFNRPVQALMEGSRAIDGGNYGYSINGAVIQGAPEELRQLCSTFNSMAEGLKDKDEEIKTASEALVEARDTAVQASMAKSQFLANMSHEIRTPMNAILGMAELLWETKLSSEQEKYVGVFRAAGENLLNIINDILDLSKIEAGHLELDKTEFDLNELIEKTGEVLALRAHEKNLELTYHIERDVPLYLKGDVVRLRQVLTNLIGNAIKFTDEGEVSLEVSTVSVTAKKAQLQFAVRDTGIGIPPDKQEHIFRRFTQVDASTTRKYGGTGLGLAISQRLVDLMGGSITVDSEVGVGSIFRFTADFDVQDTPPVSVALSVEELQGLKALIIDDNDTNRFILTETLTAWGARVTACADGPAGLAELERVSQTGDPFQLVLLDGCMPGMDGFSVAASIKSNPGLAGVTVMMLTSAVCRGDIARCSDLGIASYLIKPVKRSELLTLILDTMGKARAVKKESTDKNRTATLKPLNILLVDDSPDNRLLIQAYLKKLPYTINTAENGQEAVVLFKSGQYDIVFMDMQMPVMDGYTATRIIREWEMLNRRSATPIIALTAYALKEDAAQSMAAGCDAHVAKPVKKGILFSIIAEHTKEST